MTTEIAHPERERTVGLRALVAVSSKHGATDEIGRSITGIMQAHGIEVDVIEPERVTRVDVYDAVVIGSALYLGRWLSPARDLVQREADDLRGRQVWLFASGPVTGVDDPADSAQGRHLLELIAGREFRLFAGLLDHDRLGILERTIVRAIGSPWGDYRQWQEIEDWASSIAGSIRDTLVPTG
jgi:menaquinone-dependent protoporphyrinogen oxidase